MKLTKLLLLLFSTFTMAQEVPMLKVGDSLSLNLSHLNIKTEITGNVAVTSYVMNFYNETQQTLEGELSFPLAQGQSITNFAMDVNGKMRNAVIVEKELGRVAYESTVRQTIDPGLLELKKGNNYKARVYPILPNNYKTVEIIFEEELNIREGNHIYNLPLSFQEPLDFNFEISIFNSELKPNILKGKKYEIDFKTSDFKISSKVKKENIIADEPFSLEIPVASSQVVSTYSSYFNVYKAFEPKSKLKTKPNSIDIYWDTSLSMNYRDIEEEFKLLNDYFKYLQNVEVKLVAFSNTIISKEQFTIKNGNWKQLKKYLESLNYDGGTSYLQLSKSNADEILFFTDGMFNLGGFNEIKNTDVYCINGLNSANHEFLQNLSQQNNGKYINLKRLSTKQALNELKTESYKFLGYKTNNNIEEVYPKKGAVVDLGFSLSGRFTESTELELFFGYGNEVDESVTIKLNINSFNSLPKRLWAKKKLQFLNLEKEDNKDEIIELAKKYHLISDYTSLIVLDRIEDYLRYKIEPPIELKAEYKERIASAESEDEIRKENLLQRKEELLAEYKDLKEWYNTKYPIKKKKEKTQPQNNSTNNGQQDNNTENSSTNYNEEENRNNRASNEEESNIQPTDFNPNEHHITGTVTSADDGLPLPGASVVVKGTSRGIQTDFDGNYAINIETDETLVISYVGYINREVALNSNSRIIDVALSLDSSTLDEVVIVGYNSTSKESLTGAVSVVSAESLSVTESLNSLNGRVAGVEISESDNAIGSPSTIVIRGQTSLNASKNPLYVVDGKIVDETETRSIETNDIHSMTVLKDADAQALYGSRGFNSVIIITTKSAFENDNDDVKALNEKIYDDIEFKPWNPESDYIKILSSTKDVQSAYAKYLELRLKYRKTPSFYIDVADFFESKNNDELALRVLSNLAEVELDNHEILKALAYKLEYFKQYDIALNVYKEILKLRPEEPHSTRDLALAYENIGNYQKAFDLLYNIIDGQLLEKDKDERFTGIEQIALVEAGHLLKKYSKEITLTEEQKGIIFPIDVDLRVVADWNHNDTDLDLWVDNPQDQRVSYKNQTTDFGDRLSEDMTDGYGPEEYLIKKGLKGSYNIEMDYYGDNVQKISGPTILKITIFKNYGKANEIKEVRVLRLSSLKDDDLIEIGDIKF